MSSTFSDLKEERNALQKHVFPKLRELCMEHGFRFQAIDLRWGVSEEAGLDQQTMKICLEEIERSQKVSPKPNFIVLLGDRYGWRPVPYQIPAKEYEVIRQLVEEKDGELLDKWFQRDKNALKPDKWFRHDENDFQPVYDLQPRNGKYEDYETWLEVEIRLNSILRKAVLQMDLNEEDKLKYFASATQQEISHGALEVEDAEDHVFCFFRKIEGLPNDESASDFVDLDSNGNYDEHAASQVSILKDELRNKIPKNIFEYSAEWNGNGITKNHLKQLCDDVYNSTARIIEDEIKKIDTLNEIEKEITAHEIFGIERARNFQGRCKILKNICDYLKVEENEPLVIHGTSGSGKTALMAYSVIKAQEKHTDSAVIYRFIGATPSSSDIRSLLESLSSQIRDIYNTCTEKKAPEHSELVEKLSLSLNLTTENKPLIIFLDALDQLSDFENARKLTWLPTQLPKNVHIIVSTTPGECLDNLEKRLSPDKILELGVMTPEEGKELLKLWLNDASRTLQPFQKKEILTNFSSNGLPLYLKLAFEEARKWKSYTNPVETRVSKTTSEIIQDLFRRLSLKKHHGSIMTSLSMGYLAASRYGLSEDEILDILSFDQNLLSDFKRRSPLSPKVDKLPVVIWSRLYFDIEPYLTERNIKDSLLLTFYHSKVVEVIHEKNLINDKKLHLNIANYFKTLEKNERKIDELPWQLFMANEWDDLKNTITDMEIFLEMMKRGKDYELTQYWLFLEDKYDMVEEYFSSLGNYALEISEKDLATCYNQLATFLELNSKLDNAETLYRRSIELREKIYGKDHPSTSSMLNNLGLLLIKKDKFEEAEPLIQKAFNINKKHLGPEHAFTAKNLGNLASAYYHKREYVRAIALMKESLKIEEIEYGPLHPNVIMTLNNLAGAYCDDGNYKEAESHYEMALEKADKGLDPEHPTKILILTNFATMLTEKGEYDRAEEMLQYAVKVNEKMLGPDNIQTTTAANNLAKLLYDKGEYDKAEPLFRRSLESKKRTQGFEHHDTVACVNNLGMVLLKKGDYDGAQELLVDALNLIEDIYGPDHPLSIGIFNNIMEVESARTAQKEKEESEEDCILRHDKSEVENKQCKTQSKTGRFLEELKIEQSKKGIYFPQILSGNSFVDSCFQIEFDEEEDDREYNSIEHVKSIPSTFYEGNREEALKIVEKSLKLYPDYYFLYLWRGLIKKELGHAEEPYRSYIMGLENSKSKASLCYDMGDFEFESGNLKEAVKWWIKSCILQHNSKIRYNNPYLSLAYVASCIGLENNYNNLIKYHDSIRAGQVRYNNEMTYKILYLCKRQADEEIIKAIELFCQYYLD